MPSKLQIRPEPFRPTLLSVPTSPHSPCSPLSPKPLLKKTQPMPLGSEETYTTHIAHHVRKRSTASAPASSQNGAEYPPPERPLPWPWKCHICRRVYALAVTRRCLNDGHYFCSGEPVPTKLKNGRKHRAIKGLKRGTPCASEFDYQGWKAYGVWRRSVKAARVVRAVKGRSYGAALAAPGGLKKKSKHLTVETSKYKGKDCEKSCDYPSECRWGPEYGVETPTAAAISINNEVLDLETKAMKYQADVDDILGANNGQLDVRSQAELIFDDVIAKSLLKKAEDKRHELERNPHTVHDDIEMSDGDKDEEEYLGSTLYACKNSSPSTNTSLNHGSASSWESSSQDDEWETESEGSNEIDAEMEDSYRWSNW